MTAADRFHDAIRAAGMTPPDVIEPGKFYRFPGVGKPNGNRAGWGRLFPDGMGGVFGCYATGLSETWQAKLQRPRTLAEQEAFREQIARVRAQTEATQQDTYANAAAKATDVWESAPLAGDDHPYLLRKRIKGNGARLGTGNHLIVPLMDGDRLISLQSIAPNGDKRFFPGGSTQGYFIIGEVSGAARLCVSEGFATGASIHEATGHPVAVAFGAGNLLWTAKRMGDRYPSLTMVIAGDDDVRTAGNPGVTKATEASAAVGGLLALPDFGSDRPEGAKDFNDLAAHRGHETVERCVETARPPIVDVHHPEAANATKVRLGEPQRARQEAGDAMKTKMRHEAMPWFPVYGAHLMQDERFIFLSLAEQGLLLSVWCSSWINRSVPADPERLAVVIRQPVAEVKTALTPGVLAFLAHPGGDEDRLCSPELEARWSEHEAKKAKESEDGSKGAAVTNEKRWGKPRTDPKVVSGTPTAPRRSPRKHPDGTATATPSGSGRSLNSSQLQSSQLLSKEKVINSDTDEGWDDGVEV